MTATQIRSQIKPKFSLSLQQITLSHNAPGVQLCVCMRVPLQSGVERRQAPGKARCNLTSTLVFFSLPPFPSFCPLPFSFSPLFGEELKALAAALPGCVGGRFQWAWLALEFGALRSADVSRSRRLTQTHTQWRNQQPHALCLSICLSLSLSFSSSLRMVHPVPEALLSRPAARVWSLTHIRALNSNHDVRGKNCFFSRSRSCLSLFRCSAWSTAPLLRACCVRMGGYSVCVCGLPLTL